MTTIFRGQGVWGSGRGHGVDVEAQGRWDHRVGWGTEQGVGSGRWGTGCVEAQGKVHRGKGQGRQGR